MNRIVTFCNRKYYCSS